MTKNGEEKINAMGIYKQDTGRNMYFTKII
jgi:hypothetical protein